MSRSTRLTGTSRPTATTSGRSDLPAPARGRGVGRVDAGRHDVTFSRGSPSSSWISSRLDSLSVTIFVRRYSGGRELELDRLADAARGAAAAPCATSRRGRGAGRRCAGSAPTAARGTASRSRSRRGRRAGRCGRARRRRRCGGTPSSGRPCGRPSSRCACRRSAAGGGRRAHRDVEPGGGPGGRHLVGVDLAAARFRVGEVAPGQEVDAGQSGALDELSSSGSGAGDRGRSATASGHGALVSDGRWTAVTGSSTTGSHGTAPGANGTGASRWTPVLPVPPGGDPSDVQGRWRDRDPADPARGTLPERPGRRGDRATRAPRSAAEERSAPSGRRCGRARVGAPERRVQHQDPGEHHDDAT